MFIIAALLLTLSPLDDALQTIRQVPECRALLKQVEKDGGFNIKAVPRTPFEAQWNPDARTIEVNLEKHTSQGHIITSVLFELHNALSDKRLQHLYSLASSRSISKELFVRKMEQMEWKNWESASVILEAGRRKGLFPKEAVLPSFKTFLNYFTIQQQTGHSQYHAQSYDLL